MCTCLLLQHEFGVAVIHAISLSTVNLLRDKLVSFMGPSHFVSALLFLPSPELAFLKETFIPKVLRQELPTDLTILCLLLPV